MKSYSIITILLSFLLLLNVSFSQTVYTIPWATTQPAFVFPIYFEEGTGQKDTLYLAYDSLANGGYVGVPSDTSFGVQKMKIDTNKFYACWTTNLFSGPNHLIDSVFKANVGHLFTNSSSNYYFPLAPQIRLHGGILPLKVSWDKILFYNDSIPFPITVGSPRGEGKLIINYSPNNEISENGYVNSNYFDYYYTLITDSVVSSPCTVRDSVTISNVFGSPQPVHQGFLELRIQAWTGLSNIIDKIYFQNINVYPNPFQSHLNISMDYELGSDVAIKIYDIQGQLLNSYTLIPKRKLSIDLNYLNSGIYLLEFSNSYFRYHKVIFKM